MYFSGFAPIGLPLPQNRVNKSVYTKILETQENNGKGVQKRDMLPLDQFGGQNIFENSFLEGIEAKKLTFFSCEENGVKVGFMTWDCFTE